MLPWPVLVLPLNCTYARFNDGHQDSNKSLHAASEIIVLHQTWTETTTKKNSVVTNGIIQNSDTFTSWCQALFLQNPHVHAQLLACK